MRSTKQKQLILHIIENSRDHKSAYAIYEEAKKDIPTIGLATIYRILSELVSLEKVKKITVEGIDHYDRKDDVHYHFICNKCGKIFDVFNYKMKTPNDLKGFVIDSIELSGLCDDCKRKGN